jgi:hypothetical protein
VSCTTKTPTQRTKHYDISSKQAKRYPIPKEILEARARKKRFETLTPILGIASVGLCLSFFSLVSGQWKEAGLIFGIAVAVSIMVYSFRRRQFRDTDEFIRDQIRQR